MREQGEDRFDHYSIVSLAAPTNFQVFRLIVFAPEASVRQCNHLLGSGFDERQKLLIGDLRRSNLLTGYDLEPVSEQAELAATIHFHEAKPLRPILFRCG